MSGQPKPALTQRAYTLRLRGADANDDTWHDALWATHEAVNKGAKAFGDWLLTLRGGLDHGLTMAKVPRGRGKTEREATAKEISDRRILLAMGWLSVEDVQHAPGEFSVASGTETQAARNDKVLAAFREILNKRRLSPNELNEWIDTCSPSLCSAIRADAVWVNRSNSFDSAREHLDLTRDNAREVLEDLVGPMSSFLASRAPDDSGGTNPGAQEDESKDFVQKAGRWLSFNFGEEEKSDKKAIAENLTVLVESGLDHLVGRPGNELLDYILAPLKDERKVANSGDKLTLIRDRIGWKPGPPSVGLLAIQNTASKTRLGPEDIKNLKAKLENEAADRQQQAGRAPVPWADVFRTQLENAIGFGYAKARYAVMLDHALRRFSSTHSWVKRAEASRRKFEHDAAEGNRLREQHADAIAWLQDFCGRQAAVTGVADGAGYRIRKGALGGRNALAWKAVVSAWTQADHDTEQDRIEAVRNTQSQWEEDEKFGHADLFEKLAADGAACVWRRNRDTDAQILIDWVAATTAACDRSRYKVPMYRHPDPLTHPVFCDFGNSRWSVHFEAQKAGRQPGNRATRRAGRRGDIHSVTLQVLRDGVIASQPFRWASKRLDKDLAINQDAGNGKTKPVTRADRAGRAAAQAPHEVEIMNVFGKKPWNARLQAPRAELEHLAKLITKGDHAKAVALRRRLHWLLTFSPQLQPAGPWLNYATNRGIYVAGASVEIGPTKEKDEWRGLAYPMWHPINEGGRKGPAKHVLSSLPGLRILSVDLGHRFAAACAVWETLSADDMNRDINGRNVLRGGIGANDLYAHVEHLGENGKVRTVIYRRVGPDTLPDGNPHPAPWARLERQFVVKLQGEERPPRAASKEKEMERVKRFAERYGLVLDDDWQRGRGVDELMSRTVRVATLALWRHARRAKITWALDPATRSVFGMGGRETIFEVGDETHIKLLVDALFDWQALAGETRWNDAVARKLWNEHVAPLQPDLQITELKREPGDVDERTRQQRRKDEDALRLRLKPIAERLAGQDRSTIHRAWKEHWEADDGSPATVVHKGGSPGPTHTTVEAPGTGWHADLRWLTDWIMGRSLPGVSSKMWTRDAGGLSLTRIATMRSLYQLHKGFAMRARPDRPRGAPEKGETNAGVAQRILSAMERMREQRVKQLASRIAASALGLGGHWKQVDVPKRDDEGRFIRRADGEFESADRWVWVEEPSPKYKPCHAVVIENLTNYRPDDLQTRRENRQLMTWSSSKVKKYLAEACQLHGLHLREVSAAYTSRQDSRTGAPGVRCSDVPVEHFLTAPWWRKAVNQAEKKPEAERSPRESYLVDLYKRCSGTREGESSGGSVRIPVRGGEIFVSAARVEGVTRENRWSGIQADLNAAANIGLKALIDPDWPGRWWYVPCNANDGRPDKDKVAGCQIIPPDRPLRAVSTGEELPEDRPQEKPGQKGGATKSRGLKREIVNYWRDLSAGEDLTCCDWKPTKGYWRDVEERVVADLRHGCDFGEPVDTGTPW